MAHKKRRSTQAVGIQDALSHQAIETPQNTHAVTEVLCGLIWRYWWVVLLSVSLVVQRHYFRIGHAWDDIRHLGLIGEVSLGRLAWLEFFLRFHNEHFIGLWKLWYIFTWKLSGTHPIGWHLGITLSHGLSAIFLYQILRSFAPNSPAPAVASFVWAGAAIGRWDNPLLWIAASHLSFAIMWLLASMWCMTKCGQERGWHWWALGMAGCTIAATGTMGVTALMTIALMVQFVWLHQGLTLQPSKRSVWILCWLIPFGCVMVWQIYVLSHADLPTTAGREAVTINGLIQGTLTLYSVALGQLLSGMIWDTQVWGVAVPIFVGVAAWLGVAFDEKMRRFTVLIFLTCAAYTLVVARARANMSPEVLASFGRFLYVPTLSWCVVIAVGGTNLLMRIVARPHLRLSIFILIACGFLVQQAGLARHSADEFVEVNYEVVDVVPESILLMQQIRSELSSSESPVEINDFPIFVRPLYQPFSVFHAYSRSDSSAGEFKVLPGPQKELGPLLDALRRVKNPQAAVWLSLLETLESFRGLYEFLKEDAIFTNQEFVIPDMAVSVAGISKPIALSEISSYLLRPDDPVHIRPITQIKPAELANVFDSLSKIDHPVAVQWRTIFQDILIRSEAKARPQVR